MLFLWVRRGAILAESAARVSSRCGVWMPLEGASVQVARLPGVVSTEILADPAQAVSYALGIRVPCRI